jgi:hypothetical protein
MPRTATDAARINARLTFAGPWIALRLLQLMNGHSCEAFGGNAPGEVQGVYQPYGSRQAAVTHRIRAYNQVSRTGPQCWRHRNLDL